VVVVLTKREGEMVVVYPRRRLKTRRQLAVLCTMSTLILLPPLVWRFTVERLVISMALGGLALVAASLAFRGLGFLATQEQQHCEPTADMTFVFTAVAVYPLAINAFLLILLTEM